MPRGREATEMIKTNDIDVCQEGERPVDPPTITVCAKRGPVIDWIAPPLPLGRKVIRRNAGDHSWAVLAVEQEELRVSPDVARVRRDKKRQIADQTHAFGTGVRFQARPLMEHQELREPHLIDLARQISSDAFERGGPAPYELVRPLHVARPLVSDLQRAKQGVVVQPMGLVLAKLLERWAQIR